MKKEIRAVQLDSEVVAVTEHGIAPGRNWIRCELYQKANYEGKHPVPAQEIVLAFDGVRKLYHHLKEFFDKIEKP